LLQRNKEKDDRDSVEQQIRKVVTACLQSVQLAVQHVCDRRQRVPVFGMNMSECPSDVREVNATRDSGVLIDVARIVVVNEIVPDCLTKNRPRKSCQSNADADSFPT
jgi:hypothetical protein